MGCALKTVSMTHVGSGAGAGVNGRVSVRVRLEDGEHDA